jgi:hypothetical protein
VHLTDHDLEALMDGEMPEGAERSARVHLEECAGCSARYRRLAEDERATADLLRTLDHPTPKLEAGALIARARQQPLRASSPSRRSLLAAGLGALVIAAVASAAVPTSPLRRYLDRALDRWREPEAAAPARLIVHQPQPPTPAQGSGVSFIPRREVEVVFRSDQEQGAIRITLTDGTMLRMRTLGEAVGYVISRDTLRVDNRKPASSYDVEVPRALPRVRIRVGERLVFEKDGAAVSSQATADSEGVYVIPFAAVPGS